MGEQDGLPSQTGRGRSGEDGVATAPVAPAAAIAPPRGIAGSDLAAGALAAGRALASCAMVGAR